MTPDERRAAVARVLATFPPLDDEQRARLTTLLRRPGAPARTTDRKAAA